MNEDYNLIEMIETQVLAFDKVSRFADASLTEKYTQAVLGRGAVPNPGIRITEEDDAVTINLELIVYYGTNIPQLCYDIQSKVKNNIEETAGIQIKAINIEIEGVDPEVNDK